MGLTDNQRPAPPKSREQRLAEQLRVNLKRRKAAERAKAVPAATENHSKPEQSD